ncbi:MAG: RNA polymerase sigma factor [Novosphingobium sp.]|nr:RNA polymerase sigma factor [Novosphingobium sp.]
MAEANEEIRARLISFLPRLRRFCHGLTGSREQGDDLLQSTVERALSRIDRWQPGTSLENWILKLASNLHIDIIRAEKVRGVSVEIESAYDVCGEDEVARLEFRSEIDAVNSAIAAMSPELRQVLTAVVIDGRTYKEAAELFDIPIGTVMSRVARARSFVGRYVDRSPREGVAA